MKLLCVYHEFYIQFSLSLMSSAWPEFTNKTKKSELRAPLPCQDIFSRQCVRCAWRKARWSYVSTVKWWWWRRIILKTHTTYIRTKQRADNAPMQSQSVVLLFAAPPLMPVECIQEKSNTNNNNKIQSAPRRRIGRFVTYCRWLAECLK